MNFAKFHTRGARGLQRMPLGLDSPYPRHTPGRAAARQHSPRRGGGAGRAGLPGHTPGGAATPEWRGGTAAPGRGGLPRAATRALYGARAGRLPPGGHLPGPGGYRAKQAAFRAARRGWRGGLPGGAATPVAYTAYAGAATGRAGAGRRATPGAARRHSYPRAGATPGGYPRRSWRSYAASCDGYAPTSWGGRLLKPGLPGAAREKGSPGRACRAKNPCARLSRAYKEALFPGSPRGFFLDKTS